MNTPEDLPHIQPRQPLPWERQPEETDTAWASFQRYRDYDPRERSLSRLASDMVSERVTDGSPMSLQPDNVKRQLVRYSSVHHWQDRIKAWDRELDRRVRETQISDVLRMRRRHSQYAQTFLEAAVGPAIEILNRIQNQTLVLAELSSADLYKLTVAMGRIMPSLIQAERLSRGETTERIEIASPSDLQVTDEHLVELWAIIEEVAGEVPKPREDSPMVERPQIEPPRGDAS